MIFICNMCMHIVGNFGSPPLFHGVIGKQRRVCDSSYTLGWHERWYCIKSNWRFVSSSSSIPPLFFFFLLSLRTICTCRVGVGQHSRAIIRKAYRFHRVTNDSRESDAKVNQSNHIQECNFFILQSVFCNLDQIIRSTEMIKTVQFF